MTTLSKLLLSTLAACTCAFTPTLFAADYPDKPIRIVVPWPAGGLVDIPARLIGKTLQERLGQPVVVENKAGAGGSIGAAEVAKATPDGHTLMVTTSALNMNQALGRTLPFDATKNFDPVAVAAYASLVLVAHPHKGPKSVQELVERAKAHPGQMNYASAGNGSPGHFAAEMLKSALGLNITHVPYKGAPPAMVDQISGRIDFHFANAAVALPQIRAGKIIALAVATPKQLPLLPGVPTMAEAGIPDFDADQWIGFLAPHGTPAPVIQRLNEAIDHALSDAEVRKTLERNGMTPAQPGNPASFRDLLAKDLAKWTRVARGANITAD